MRIEHRDFLRFALYFCVFFMLIFYAIPVFSPIQWAKESFYDSSSIKNKEELPADFTLLSPHASGTSESVKTPQTDGAPFMNVSWSSDSSGTFSAKSAPSPVESASPKTLPKLTFRFRPDNVQIDSRFSRYLEDNLSSSLFASRIPALSIVMDAGMTDPRGKLVGRELSISPNMDSDSEFIKVLVHEMGHVIDIYYLVGSKFQKDPSDAFYEISWLDYEHKKKGASLADFVSGYALSNKYEDFAESFSFFIFHNADFERLAKQNTSLRQKYDFFTQNVFENAEFSGTSFESKAIPTYNWDTTKISIDTKKYLFYLK